MAMQAPIVTLTEVVDDLGHHVMLRGRLCRATVPDLRPTLHRLVDDGHSTLFADLAELEVIDRAAFSLLVACLQRCRHRGRRLVVTAADPRLVRLARRARLSGLMPVTGPEAENRGEPVRWGGIRAVS